MIRVIRLFSGCLIGLEFLVIHVVTAQQASPTPDRLGKVHFETSCNVTTREEFDHAMALLHSFEFPPAIDGFQRSRRSGC